jgi:hypothetical protein
MKKLKSSAKKASKHKTKRRQTADEIPISAHAAAKAKGIEENGGISWRQ